jgi:hypothetical protein
VKAGVETLRSINVNTMFTVAQNFKTNNSITAESTMARNADWGAMVYLAHSKYGRNGVEPTINNNSSYLTGHPGNAGSTTGNIYGVFDTNGGTWEYTMAFLSRDTTTTSLPTVASTGFSDVTLTNNKRFYDIYARAGDGSDRNNNYNANRGVKGDAAFETSTSGDSGAGSWFGAYSDFPGPSLPVFFRSGGWGNGSGAGPFYFSYLAGTANSGGGFRVVVLPFMTP